MSEEDWAKIKMLLYKYHYQIIKRPEYKVKKKEKLSGGWKREDEI